MASSSIEHDPAAMQFFVRSTTSKGEVAHLDYSLDKNSDSMDLYHTFVPPSLRGGGIAAKLCDHAFDYADEKGFKIVPSCSYVSDAYLRKNPHRSKSCL